MDFSALSGFLKYGPIGLAGLLLVLTIYALLSKNFNQSRERLLAKVLYVGAFCFVVACIFAFLPQYATAQSQLQQEASRIDQEKARAAEVKLRADQYVSQLNQMRDAIKSASASANSAISDLNDLSAMQNGKICSGGPSGQPAVDAPKLVAKTAEVLNKVGKINSIIASLLQ